MTFQDLEQDHPVRLSSLLLKPLYVAKDTENSKKIHMTRVQRHMSYVYPTRHGFYNKRVHATSQSLSNFYRLLVLESIYMFILYIIVCWI